MRQPSVLGAVVCGAMFGDNLSMISDTTIAAVKTQGCEMKDKFRENFLIVLPAAVVTIGIFLFLTSEETFQMDGEMVYSFWKILPYLVVLIGALAGVNVFLVLMTGTVLSLAVGVFSGEIAASEMFQASQRDRTEAVELWGCMILRSFPFLWRVLSLWSESWEGSPSCCR